MVKKVCCLSAALLLGVAVTPVQAQAQAQYKMTIEAESATGTWKIGLGAAPGQTSLVWADFNGNGTKDAGESWNAASADASGVCNFSQRRTSSKLDIYGPVSILTCGENGLLSINAGGNPDLQNLAANDNSISIIDLTKNTKLQRVNLSSNQINRISLQGLSSLVDLRLAGNAKMSSLDLGSVDALQTLDISETKVTRLTNANLSQLTRVNVSAVAEFDITSLYTASMLVELGMSGNKATTFDLKKFPNLQRLWAPNCELEQLDFSGNPNLTQLMLNYNKLKGADFTNNLKLRKVYLENNSLQYLRLPGEGSQVDVLDIAGVKSLTTVDLSKQAKLWVLQVDGSGLTSLDLSANPRLAELVMSQTEIKELDLTNAPDLNTLNVSECAQLTKLNLSINTELVDLNCGKSGLKELDLRACVKLREFSGKQNGFTSLTFHSTKLQRVDCSGNSIEGDAMTKLIASLPRVSSGEFFVVDLSVSGNENKCTPAQVKMAKDKGWKVYDRNIGGSDYRLYPGQDHEAIDELAASSVRLYPTVASRAFTLEGAAGREYFVYSMAGELVARGMVTDGEQSISVVGLTAGRYLVRIGGVRAAFKVQVVAD